MTNGVDGPAVGSPMFRQEPALLCDGSIALVAVIITAINLAKPYTAKGPGWLQTFIPRQNIKSPDLGHSRLDVWLLASISWSIFMEIVRMMLRKPTAADMLRFVPLGLMIFMTVKDCIQELSLGMLFICIGISLARFWEQYFGAQSLPIALLQLFSLAGVVTSIVVICAMPMQKQDYISREAACGLDTPSDARRSPEDRFSLWQYMTVTWMSPLIRLASRRQLNEEDIWSLAYEFEHAPLHERFRSLNGPLVARLLAANGRDLLCMTLFEIPKLAAVAMVPILLKNLLHDLQAPEPQHIVLLATMILLMHLFAAQMSVFSLWHGRRCYERSRGEMITMLHEKVLNHRVTMLPDDLISEHKSASIGQILNIMRNDVYEVSDIFWNFPRFLITPLRLVVAIILTWQLIGWPCLLGLMTILVSQFFDILIMRILVRLETQRRQITDTKLYKISHFVDGIRHLRYYDWQDKWLESILTTRQIELHARLRANAWRMLQNLINVFAGDMFPVVAFFAYSGLAGLPLTIDIAFPALAIFAMLKAAMLDLPALISTILNASVALTRIQRFMAEPDQPDLSLQQDPSHFGTEDATFAWPGTQSVVLKSLNLNVRPGLTVVTGRVGSGKSALLRAMLGELDLCSGRLSPFGEDCGFCSQTPWLQSMSIRDNILFGFPYLHDRYQAVIDVCALRVDFNQLEHGDQSLLGENGIGLSGGQRSRVALARALFSEAPILLLDDPLAALDHPTAKHIVENAFKGSLCSGRTIVLVTHRLELCRELADQLIHLDHGSASTLDQKSVFCESLPNAFVQDKDIGVPENFLDDETRKEGGVQTTVYWTYIKAGCLPYWGLLILVTFASRLSNAGEKFFLKEWGEAYTVHSSMQKIIANASSVIMDGQKFFQQEKPRLITAEANIGGLPSPEENITPWLWAFLAIACVRGVILLLSNCVMLAIIYTAGRDLFIRVMQRVTNATFRFYDVTPVGRLMNRLTSDIGTVDGNISQQFQSFVLFASTWLFSVIIIASITPTFLVFSILITAVFVFVFSRFLPPSQSLRRLEMVSLSPLMSNFGNLLHGLSTVRGFGVQHQFQERVIAVTDNFQKMDHFYWSLQSWLMYRFDLLSALSTFLLTLIAFYSGVSAGLTAFALTAAEEYVQATHQICRQYGQLQLDFVSVERVVELLHIEQEPKNKQPPPASWPAYGADIVFEDVAIRYADHLKPSLQNINLRIPGGSSVALLGRTGSGKSTLALSLLATTIPFCGRILVDGIDIAKVDAGHLRRRVTFLAQDPILFPGTMQDNIDPLDEYPKLECQDVLRRVCKQHDWQLNTRVDVGGGNFSQGQRQLVGLARAILKKSPIVVMDEAMASIDGATASQVQRLLREEMRASTVITIAHRLEAVEGADCVIRLDQGQVVENGTRSNH